MTGLRTIAEIGVGLLFGVGAVFHVAYTLRHGDEFYGSFADGAWLSPARRLIKRLVLPNTTALTIVLILFQASVAVSILSRGEFVTGALWAGAGFAGLAALASSPGGTAGNALVAALSLVLAISR